MSGLPSDLAAPGASALPRWPPGRSWSRRGVAVPHGWGHQRAKGLTVAGRTQGVNVNLLAADGPERLDPVSGMAHLTGFPVRVRPAAGPKDESDWSGMPVGE